MIINITQGTIHVHNYVYRIAGFLCVDLIFGHVQKCKN